MIREHIAFALGLALLVAFALLHGCGSRAMAVTDVAAYASALSDCRAEGKAARSFEIYEECAAAADRRFGVTDGGVP